MLILALDTSGPLGSLALCEETHCLSQQTLAVHQRHAQELIPAIDQLLKSTGRAIHDCQLIAVGIGPGSFTGVRVGVVCAKMLAYVTGAQLVGIDTLQAIAQSIPSELRRSNTVWVVDNAQRGDVFAGEYEWTADEVCHARGPIRLISAGQLASELPAAALVTGPGTALLEPFMPVSQILQPAVTHPEATAIARLGTWQLQTRGSDDLATLEPRYIRLSAAEETWLARQAAASAALPATTHVG